MVGECRESLVLDFLYRRYHHEDGITIEPIDPDDVFASMGSDTIPGSDTPLLPVLRCIHMHPEEKSDGCASRAWSPLPAASEDDSHAECEPCDLMQAEEGVLV